MEKLVVFLNTPVAWELVAAVLVLLVRWVFTRKEAWKDYEGYVISAVKMAEKLIPSGTANTADGRRKKALELFIACYEANEGKDVPWRLERQVEKNIPVVHDRLEKEDTL